MNRLVRAMGLMTTAAVLGGGLLAPEVTALPPPAIDPAPTIPSISVSPISTVPVVASKNGRYVVQRINGRLELHDRKRDRTIKRLPARAEAANVSVSDNGRYVTYTVPGKGESWDRTRRTVRVYDRKTGKTRTATTTKAGRALKPKWRTTCVGDSGVECDRDETPLTAAPQLDGGQISGNGRYVVFCANYIKPDRIDLYIKNWRTKSLKRVNGACSYERDSDPPAEWVLPPTVSDRGTVVLLPGFRRRAEDLAGCWEPSRALIKRRTLIEVGGREPTMTHDGRLISSIGPTAGCDDGFQSATVDAVWWFEVGTRTLRPAELPGLQLTMHNASRHGRYVLLDNVIWDRTRGIRYDLAAALAAAGFTAGGVWHDGWGYRDPLIAGDGQTVFLNTTAGPVAVRWAPPG